MIPRHRKLFDDFSCDSDYFMVLTPTGRSLWQSQMMQCNDLNHSNSKTSKKRVVFADDRGFPLAFVRTVTEPSNMPPRWSFQFLSQVTQGAVAEAAPEPWEITFPQPASDYFDFRRRLDTNSVSLENVIVKETEQAVVGTIKVRNLEFHKQVFVRTTSDDWKTQEDAFCTYVANGQPAHGVTVLYDTFSFRLVLPPRSGRFQFCVCFRCSGLEYWDNNSGKNYMLVKRDSPAPECAKDRAWGEEDKSDNLKWNVQQDAWSAFTTRHHRANHTP